MNEDNHFHIHKCKNQLYFDIDHVNKSMDSLGNRLYPHTIIQIMTTYSLKNTIKIRISGFGIREKYNNVPSLHRHLKDPSIFEQIPLAHMPNTIFQILY